MHNAINRLIHLHSTIQCDYIITYEMLQGEAGLSVPFSLRFRVVMKIISVTHKKLGQRVKKLRKEKNLTQEDLAFQVGVDRSYMGFVERGEKNPTLKTIQKIAKALKVSPKDLL